MEVQHSEEKLSFPIENENNMMHRYMKFNETTQEISLILIYLEEDI